MGRAASINYASTLTLLPEWRFVHRASSFEHRGLAEAVDDAVKAFRYETFPQRVESRCLGELKNKLAWVEDGLAYWHEVREFVHCYITIYYPNSEAVLEDPEVMDFWNMVTELTPTYGLPPLDKGDQEPLELLIDFLASVIFGVTGDHELYGTVMEYWTTPMGLSTKMFNETDPRNGMDLDGQVCQDVQTYLQATAVIAATGVPMPRLIADWAHLMYVQEADLPNWKNRVQLNVKQRESIQEYLKILKTKSVEAKKKGVKNPLNTWERIVLTRRGSLGNRSKPWEAPAT